MRVLSAVSGHFVKPTHRIDLIMQSEAAECGLATLAMVSAFYGQVFTISELRRRFKVSAKGTNLRALMDIADHLGLSARPVKCEIPEVAELNCPAILHWELKHFVLLERVRRGRYLIHDPARGTRWIERSELSRCFTGVAVEFSPTAEFVQQHAERPVRIRSLIERVRGIVPSIVQMTILAIIGQILGLIPPILTQQIVDEAILKADTDLITIISIGLIAIAVLTSIVIYIQGLMGLYMGTQMSYQFQTNLLRHLLRLPVSWFEKRHVGDVLSRFASLGPVQDVLTTSVSNITLNLLMSFAAGGMMVIYSPALSAIVFGSCFIILTVRAVSFPFVRSRTLEGLHLNARVQTTFLETVRGARAFKLFGREQERVALWQNAQTLQLNNQVQLARLTLMGSSGNTALLGIQQALVLALGARAIVAGQLSLGMLLAFQAFAAQFFSASGTLLAQWIKLRTLRVHLERLGDVIFAEWEAGVEIPPDPARSVAGAIELKNVSFRYADHEPWVLSNLSLSIKPGEFICFQGPSGHGKSTILKLCLGFIEPTAGEVLIDDIPLRQLGIRNIRQYVSAVFQDDQLFTGTIADNISFFDVEASESDVREAALKAQIDEEIRDFPMGYNTFVGDLGSTLSAGQRQRILLARALYRRPRILFLDEGTANLDPVAEKEVMSVISALNITRVVVAHRDGASHGAQRVLRVANAAASEIDTVQSLENVGCRE